LSPCVQGFFLPASSQSILGGAGPFIHRVIVPLVHRGISPFVYSMLVSGNFGIY
jgi:hypothetical protein